MNTDYVLDNSWKLARDGMTKIQNKLKYADPLEQFILHHDYELAKDELFRTRGVRKKNFELFLKACKYVGLPRVYLGSREIVGADGVETTNTEHKWRRVAVWQLVDLISAPYSSSGPLTAGCGNSDQYQINNADMFFMPERLGKAYNVSTKRRISTEPFRKRFVCSG